MTDFIAKARANRIIALNLHQKGAMMFFPEEAAESEMKTTGDRRRAITQVSKPMFVRSASLHASAIVATPDQAQVANAAHEPLVLTEEHAVRKAA